MLCFSSFNNALDGYFYWMAIESAGMADLVLVNSRFTAATFAKTFRHLNAQGVRPAVLYPAVNVEQFEGPCAYK